MSIKEKRFLHNEDGLTLIEIIIAIAILGVIVGIFLSGFITSSKINARTRKMNSATFVSQRTMEDIYSLSISAPDGVSSFTHTIDGLIDKGFSSDMVDGIYTLENDNLESLSIRVIIDTANPVNSFYKVYVEAYRDDGYTDLVTKMENLMKWQ